MIRRVLRGPAWERSLMVHPRAARPRLQSVSVEAFAPPQRTSISAGQFAATTPGGLSPRISGQRRAPRARLSVPKDRAGWPALSHFCFTRFPTEFRNVAKVCRRVSPPQLLLGDDLRLRYRLNQECGPVDALPACSRGRTATSWGIAFQISKNASLQLIGAVLSRVSASIGRKPNIEAKNPRRRIGGGESVWVVPRCQG